MTNELESEDNEDTNPKTRWDTDGLHAKLYLLETNKKSKSYTHFVLGSANATNAALDLSKNVEILIDLVGERTKLGDIESLIEDEDKGSGLGVCLEDFNIEDVQETKRG